MSQDNKPWKADAVPADQFHEAPWANINGAPYDQISGVIYKRSVNIKQVLYEPANPAPDMPELWQGQGAALVRWLFSEQAGTEEHLLEGATMAFIHDTVLQQSASTGMQAQTNTDEILYVIAGEGMLHHRPTPGSPVVARPLRPGDAALVRGGEYHNITNTSDDSELRFIVIGLNR